MIVLEFKLKGKPQQYRVIDEMIRTAQFVRNKALRYWIDNQGVKLVELYKQCAIMAKLDRDHNAALNIRATGLKARAGINLNTVGHTEINAWGQADLYSLVVTSTSKLTD
jgi:hypothetical protein